MLEGNALSWLVRFQEGIKDIEHTFSSFLVAD